MPDPGALPAPSVEVVWMSASAGWTPGAAALASWAGWDRARAYALDAVPDDEGDLLQRVAGGDREALRALVDEVGSQGMALAVRVTGNRDLAEEAVQDAFLDVWLKARRFDPARGRARQWVLTLVHHRAVDVVRRERAVTRSAEKMPFPEPPDDPEEHGWMSDRRARVLEAVDSLPRGQRDAIMLAYFSGLTYRQVAERLRIPEGTAKSRLRDGLLKLRGLMETSGIEW